MLDNTMTTQKAEEIKFDNSSNYVSSEVFLPRKTFYDYAPEQNEPKLWLDDFGWI